MSGEFFNLYLHQNYPDFFSEVEDVDRASEYLSDADLLTADWTVSLLICYISNLLIARHEETDRLQPRVNSYSYTENECCVCGQN